MVTIHDVLADHEATLSTGPSVAQLVDLIGRSVARVARTIPPERYPAGIPAMSLGRWLTGPMVEE